MSDAYPVISTRKNGDRLVGIAGPLAQDLYDTDRPPMHGLAKKPAPSPRLAHVRIGDRLRVERVEGRWFLYDCEGQLGKLRWQPGQDGKTHAATGRTIRLPAAGTLHVQRLVVGPNGVVKDVAGYVEPD